MREILFRGKTVNTNRWIYRWIYGYYSLNYGDDMPQIREKKECCCVEVIPESVGQYTGLTDMNGKKIFEGDIVKATYHSIKEKNHVLGTVVFENGTFKLSVFGQVKDGEFSFIFSVYDDKKTSKYAIENNFIFRDYLLEVIGNIHDNPELLKGGVE